MYFGWPMKVGLVLKLRINIKYISFSLIFGLLLFGINVALVSGSPCPIPSVFIILSPIWSIKGIEGWIMRKRSFCLIQYHPSVLLFPPPLVLVLHLWLNWRMSHGRGIFLLYFQAVLTKIGFALSQSLLLKPCLHRQQNAILPVLTWYWHWSMTHTTCLGQPTCKYSCYFKEKQLLYLSFKLTDL